MLNDDLVAELQATNQYHEHILDLANEEAVNTLENIGEEEMEHIAKLMKLI